MTPKKKRFRPSSPPNQASSNEEVRPKDITDLQDDAIRTVASYLPKTSRALLAVALTTDSSSWKAVRWNHGRSSASTSMLSWLKQPGLREVSAATRAIILPPPPPPKKKIIATTNTPKNKMWEEMDLEDIREEGLASKLSDDDLAAMLSCINALHNLKVLKLTGCDKILGRGLEPLRGSRTIIRLDFSMVGHHESPSKLMHLHNDREIFLYALSEQDVIPICESIVENEGHSLRHIQFPKSFRSRRLWIFRDFLERFNQLTFLRDARCKKCYLPCQEVLCRVDYAGVKNQKRYGIQQNTCYDCLNQYCYQCEVGFCFECEKEFCSSCVSMTTCSRCDGEVESSRFCENCVETKKCKECEDVICQSDDCGGIVTCDSCHREACNDCMNMYHCSFEGCCRKNCSDCHGGKNVRWCEDCDAEYCVEHWVLHLRNKLARGNHCEGCIDELAPQLTFSYDYFEQDLQKDVVVLRKTVGRTSVDMLSILNSFECCMNCGLWNTFHNRLEECRESGWKNRCIVCKIKLLTELVRCYDVMISNEKVMGLVSVSEVS